MRKARSRKPNDVVISAIQQPTNSTTGDDLIMENSPEG